jgi:hypothetical protein
VVRAGFGMFYDAFSQDMVMGHLPYVGYSTFPVRPTTTSALIRSFTTVAVGGAINLRWHCDSAICCPPTTCNFECDAFGFDRNIKTPYMENYNLNIQQQITSKAVIQASLRRFTGAIVCGDSLTSASPAMRPSLRAIWAIRTISPRWHRVTGLRRFTISVFPATTSQTILTARPTFSRRIPLASPTTTRCS